MRQEIKGEAISHYTDAVRFGDLLKVTVYLTDVADRPQAGYSIDRERVRGRR